MQNRTKLGIALVLALVVSVWLMFKESKPKITYSNLNDCYVKGYYDGRVAIYNAFKSGYVTMSYLDSTFTADSLEFNKTLK